MQTAEQRAFIAAADLWLRSREPAAVARMLRSPLSGIPQPLGAAYAALARSQGSFPELLESDRLAAGASRDAVLRFAAALRAKTPVQPAVLDAPITPYAQNSALTLCEPVEAEPGEVVRAPATRFSASQLNTYAECARKWFYRYLCSAVEDKGSSASFYGTAFHAALEAFHQEFPQPAQAGAEELLRRLSACIKTAFDVHREHFETPVEHELQLRRAQRTARRYVEWLLAEGRRAPFTVVGCELATELQMEGYEFVGYIDRIDRDDATGTVSVIDYKTGSIATSAEEYRAQVAAFEDFQLPFYYWARTEAGDRVSRLALVPLKDSLLDVRPVALDVVPFAAERTRSRSPSGRISVAELERARTRMIELCREISEGTHRAFPVATDPDACTYCSYLVSCAGRPYPAENRFAR